MAASDSPNNNNEESHPRAELPGELKYIQYQHSLEAQYLPAIRALISKDLSEPYSIYVYRYFLCQWGHLCYMVSLGTPGSPSPSCC
jgi:peptide alpha-N-acetyltransferase